MTDANGEASSGVTPSAAGDVTLEGTAGSLSVVAGFPAQVAASKMQLTSAPTGTNATGQAAGAPFTVQVSTARGAWVNGDGITFSVAPGSVGSVVFSGCGMATCTAFSNQNGVVSMVVTPVSVGAVTLVASDAEGLTAQATFTAVNAPDVLVLTSPANQTAVVGAELTAAVRLFASDGVTGLANQVVTFVFSSGLTPQSGGSPQGQFTDYYGQASLRATADAPGLYTTTASVGSLSVVETLTFIAPPLDQLTFTGVPTGVLALGVQAGVPVTAHLADGYGKPLAGVAVNLAGPTFALQFSCGSFNCPYVTDLSGNVASVVTPMQSGILPISALATPRGTAAGLVATASLTVAGGVPTLTIVQAPPATVVVGSKVTFQVQLLSANGTPVAGLVADYTIAGTFANPGCPFGQCRARTDARGMVTITGTASTPGQVTITLFTAGLEAQTSFVVVANTFTLIAGEPQMWVAEGVAVESELDVTAMEHGAAANDIALVWTSRSGFGTVSASSTTNTLGASAMEAIAGPLDAGVNANVTACGWTNVCANFEATGVSASLWQLAIASGGAQKVTNGVALVVVRVTDGQGHAVAGAPVTIGQTVYADDGSCPATGACPPTPALASEVTVTTSDLLGEVTVQPLGVAGTATRTAMSFASGLQGAVTTFVISIP